MAIDKKLQDFHNALNRLNEAVEITKEYKDRELFSFFRDSAVQRFEFTLEITWKSIKSFLLEYEGIECRSPKGCIRDFLLAGYLNPTDINRLLMMVDDRNLATHTYHESLADEIFLHIQEYLPILQNIHRLLKDSIKQIQ